MNNHFIFGYGSLVNRDTHEFAVTHPAKLTGWRREWRYTTLRDVAFLNVVPDAGCTLQGLIMATPLSDADLDKREYAYTRHDVSTAVRHDLREPVHINVFAIADAQSQSHAPDHVILLSYIDVVVQGYFQVYGEAGVAAFFETTTGWQTTVVNDRAAPRYPRHQPPHSDHMALVDHWLALSPAVVKEL